MAYTNSITKCLIVYRENPKYVMEGDDGIGVHKRNPNPKVVESTVKHLLEDGCEVLKVEYVTIEY